MAGHFEKFAQPGVRLMQNLRLRTKFMWISLAFMVPLAMTLYAVVDYANAGIQFAVSERIGSDYLKAMNELLKEAAAARNGERRMSHSSALSALQELTDEHDDSLKLQNDLKALVALSDANQVIAKLLDMYTAVGDNSNLILDPDLDSYYVMTVVVDYGPKLLDATTLLAARLANKSGAARTPEAIAEIRFLTARVKSLQQSIQQAVQRVVQINSSAASTLDGHEWQQPVEQLLVVATAVEASSTEPVNLGMMASDTTAQLALLVNKSVVVLDGLLDKRIGGFVQRRNLLLMLTVISLLACGYLITSFYLCNLRGFEALVARMNKLSNGDLSVNYPARGSDEIGDLINSFNDSRLGLQVMVERIRHAADTISTAGIEIAKANLDLSQRSSAQSAVIGEAADQVKQISERVQSNLTGSNNATRVADEAFSVAKRGKLVVDSVVNTMDSMTSSSKRIGAIIDVINEIAFQTNLLALNAAVEAARAGEQGRGFAVVAGEVRNLAQRCAKAANEITLLIKNSVDDVNKGVGQVAKAGASMDEVLESVRTVSDIMGEMATASHTQAEGIRVVDRAVDRIDTDAQQNAALVEQTASAAELLREQVAVLMQSVGHFKLGSAHPVFPEAGHDLQPDVDAELYQAA